MESITNSAYWILSSCIAVGFAAIAFSWEHMRRQLNQVLPAEHRISMFPAPAITVEELVWKTNELGHFLDVLDQYRKIRPSSSLPKKVAFAVVIWILCLMGLLASGVGR